MYALVDCNSFFASCEQIFRPDLRGKPVVVLSNNDGCIVARSKEAKALNIPDLQAYFKVKPFLDKHNVHVFSSNYELYGDISSRIVTVLNELAPEIEVYSIDECFLLLDSLSIDYGDYGKAIKKTVWRDIRMPVSVGIANSKTLSKLANHIAKKSNRLAGVCVINNIEQWHNVFKKLPVSTVWGVGSRLSKRLDAMGIHSAYDLKVASPKAIRQSFSVNLERTISELNGERCISLETQVPPKQQIYSTRSFGEKVYTLEALQQAVSQYATKACEKLRKQKCLVKVVSAYIETSRFNHVPVHRSGLATLDYPTNDTREVITAVKQIITPLFESGVPYAKAGVGLVDIVPNTHRQLNIFDAYQSKQSESLMGVVDTIKVKGLGHINYASSGIDPLWQMQRGFKSPAYTTRLNDLLPIKI